MITVIGTAVSLSVGTSTGSVTFTAPTIPGAAIHLCNAGDNRVTVALGVGSATAVLDQGITLPPNSQIILDLNPQHNFIAAIAAAAGNVLVATPVRVL